jgi:hypothetical protein
MSSGEISCLDRQVCGWSRRTSDCQTSDVGLSDVGNFIAEGSDSLRHFIVLLSSRRYAPSPTNRRRHRIPAREHFDHLFLDVPAAHEPEHRPMPTMMARMRNLSYRRTWPRTMSAPRPKAQPRRVKRNDHHCGADRAANEIDQDWNPRGAAGDGQCETKAVREANRER